MWVGVAGGGIEQKKYEMHNRFFTYLFYNIYHVYKG